MRKIFSFLVGVLATASIISCSSDDNNDNSTLDDNFKDRSLIKSVTIFVTLPYKVEKHKYSLTYNPAGNLQSIFYENEYPNSSENSQENYSWTSDSIKVNLQTSSNLFWSTEKYARNSNGYATSCSIVFNYIIYGVYTAFHDFNCYYNEKNQLSYIDGRVDYTDEEYNYTWKNGNITLINKSNHLYELEYYDDLKESRDIGARYIPINFSYYFNWGKSLRGEIYGENPMFLSKNLLKKHFDGSTLKEYSYTFDSKGRVISQKVKITGYISANIIHKEYNYQYVD